MVLVARKGRSNVRDNMDGSQFQHLKKCLVSQSWKRAQETKDIAQNCLKGWPVTFFSKGVQKPVHQCKCLNLCGNCGEE
jgi:hypothetical protein